MSDRVERAYPDKVKLVIGDDDFEVYGENAICERPSEIYVRASLLPQLGEAATTENVKDLLDECYDAIATAIYSEDGFDDCELLDRIETIVGKTETVKAWNDDTRPVT